VQFLCTEDLALEITYSLSCLFFHFSLVAPRNSRHPSLVVDIGLSSWPARVHDRFIVLFERGLCDSFLQIFSFAFFSICTSARVTDEWSRHDPFCFRFQFCLCLFIFCHLSLFFWTLCLEFRRCGNETKSHSHSRLFRFVFKRIQSHFEMYSLSTVYLLKLRKKPPFYISVQVVVWLVQFLMCWSNAHFTNL